MLATILNKGIGVEFSVTLTDKFGTYTQKYKLMNIDDTLENSDRQYLLQNSDNKSEFGVEKNWFNTILTGRKIQIIK